MPTAIINTVKLSGTQAIPVKVDCSVTNGLGIHLVGLADSAVKNCLLRVVTALQSNRYRIPGKKIIINLSPADISKSGSSHDLALALALIAATGQDKGADDDGSGNLSDVLYRLPDWLVHGELGLDGSVRAVSGCVQAVEAAMEEGLEGVIIPSACTEEVADLFTAEDIPIYGVASLAEAVACVAGPGYFPTIWDNHKATAKESDDSKAPSWDRLADAAVRRAIEIAASGGHHVLIAGAAGTGKEMAAMALADILPPMTREEALSVARVYSTAGKGLTIAGARRRPFRSPHHSSGLPAMLGGGQGETLIPGEVSLATEGVLCLQEFAETPRSVKEALRGPLEDKKVTLSRLRSRVEFPARFQLVLTTTLNAEEQEKENGATSDTTLNKRYLGNIHGPVYDMVDIQVRVSGPVSRQGTEIPEEGGAAAVSRRVSRARMIQNARLGDGRLNADMTASEIATFCVLEPEEKELVEKLIGYLGLSVRSYNRILKIARTLADMEGREFIGKADIAEAAGYRFLDRLP